MTENKGILIKNIYYMLAYAFQSLKQNNYKDVLAEDFDNINDLFARILAIGVSERLKRGLYKEYIVRKDSLNTLRGKLDTNGTIRNYVQNKRFLDCEFDELSENCLFNQIIKITIVRLLKCKDVKKKQKALLNTLKPFFDSVDCIDLKQIKWNSLRYDRNNISYEFLHFICNFILNHLILSTEAGVYRVRDFTDEYMNKLFEKFVLEYYKKEHPKLCADSSYIPWFMVEDESSTNIIPKMHTDITLNSPNKTLIIDTKYYSKTLAENLNKKMIHTNNLYQIFSYVTNKDTEHSGNVDGILLYAKTQESIVPDGKMVMKTGNVIYFKTLDLNQDFTIIKKQLDEIASLYLMQNSQTDVLRN